MSGIRDRIGATSSEQVVRHMNIMFYGDPGAGKTYLGGSAADSAETSPVLILDVEGGTATLRRRKDIDVVRIDSVAKFNQVYDELEKDPSYYKTLVFDSVTEFQKLDMADVMAEAVKKNPREDKDVASQRSWGITINHMRTTVRALRDLPYHVIFTALAKTEQDSDGTIITSPSLPGKLAGEIPGFLDVMGYLYVDIEKGASQRKLQVQPTRRVKAKDRLGVTNGKGVLINPTFPMMLENMNNDETNTENNEEN